MATLTPPARTTHRWLQVWFAFIESLATAINVMRGGTWKGVRVITVAPLAGNAYVAATKTKTASANGKLTVDGIDLAAGDRFWDNHSATGSERGLFQVVSAGGAGSKWSAIRSDDAWVSADYTDGKHVVVGEGTYQGQAWYLTNDTFVLDTDTPAIARESNVMITNVAQGVTAAKTFVQDMLRVYNGATTFYHQFRSASTANRTVTLPDADCTLAQSGVASGAASATACTGATANDAGAACTGATASDGGAACTGATANDAGAGCTGATASDGAATVPVYLPLPVPAAWAIDGDGARTNGGGLVGQPPKLTAMAVGDAVVYDAGTVEYEHLAVAGATWRTVNYQLLPDAPANGDAVLFRFDKPSPELALDMSATLAQYTGVMGKWQYSNGAGTWADVAVYDNTNAGVHDGSQPFARDGAITLGSMPADWTADTYSGDLGFWLRYLVTDATKFTQNGVTNNCQHDKISGDQGWYPPQDFSLTALWFADNATNMHAANPVVLLLWDEISGTSRSFSFTASRRSLRVAASSPWPLTTAARIFAYIISEDGTNEPADAVGFVEGTISTPNHSHAVGTLAFPSHSHAVGTLAFPNHSHAVGTLAFPSHSHAVGTLAGPAHTHNQT